MGELVIGHEHGRARGVQDRAQDRIAARTREVSETEVPGAEALRPADGPVQVPASGGGFVERAAFVDGDGKAQPPPHAGKRPFAEASEQKSVDGAEGLNPREVHHRLPQLLLSVDILDEVRLIDDVDEVVGLDDAPEDSAEARSELPALRGEAIGELAEVEMGPVRILRVDPHEWRCFEALATAVPPAVVLRLEREGSVAHRLLGEERTRRKDARVEREKSRPPVVGAGSRGSERREGQKRTKSPGSHRTFFRLFWSNWRSVSPVPSS